MFKEKAEKKRIKQLRKIGHKRANGALIFLIVGFMMFMLGICGLVWINALWASAGK